LQIRGDGLANDSRTGNQMASDCATQLFTESFSSSGAIAGYSNTVAFTYIALLTVNYYDNYDFLPLYNPGNILTNATPPAGYTPPAATPSAPAYAKTLLTGTRVYHLDNPLLFEATTLYYDKYGRVVQTRATNHLGGYDVAYNALDFTGKPTATQKVHGKTLTTTDITEVYGYTYDNAQRLLTTTHQLNGGAVVTLASNTYDDLGRVQTKTVGGTLDATNYSYNIRSWVTGITGSRFTENLCYNQNTAGLSSFNACYNGNIAAMQWSIPADNIGSNRIYTFGYDGLNRLTDSFYRQRSGTGDVPGTIDRYTEQFTYDKMGNITHLYRTDFDNVDFNYNGNQLKTVNENAIDDCYYGDEEYFDYAAGVDCRAYDKNGNVTYDYNSGSYGVWGIRYNALNLPNAIQFYEGHQMLYTYSAAGTKLKVVDKTAPDGVTMPVSDLNTIMSNPSVASTTATDYVGNYIYETDNSGTRSLSMILLPEGYWQGGHYHYYLKDHLGSNRVVLRDDNSILERNHYYPSGARFKESIETGGSIQPYRHTGHEMQAMHGLNWIDNGARFRTVSEGDGFLGIDPLCEKYYRWSPYVYAVDNPMRFTDNDGEGPNDRVKKAYGMIGTSYFREMSSALRTQQTPEALRYMDCAEFVCRVLAADQITNGVKHMNSSYLQSYLNNKNQFILSQSPQIGDIALWDGHVGIVTGIGKNGAIKLTHASGHLNGAIENPTAIDPRIYRPGSKFYGYYRPIVETPDGKLDGEDEKNIVLDEIIVLGEESQNQNQSQHNKEWQEYIKQQNEANSTFQRGRPHEGDNNYQGSFWQAYDDVKNFGNANQKNQSQP